jgi:hypothetical protein
MASNGNVDKVSGPFAVPVCSNSDLDQQTFQQILQTVVEKLKHDPLSITPEDARRFQEHAPATNPPTARVLSAIEALAAAHDDIAQKTGAVETLSQNGHASLDTIVRDLHAAVDKCPGDVNAEILSLTQSVVAKMQKALGAAAAPHPELEAELQQEFKQIKTVQY